MHFLPGYCWKYGAEYFLWCFKPICSGNLRAGPCALRSRFQFAVAWSAPHSSWDAPKWEVLWGAGSAEPQGTGNIVLGSSRAAASPEGLFYEKGLLVDGGTACAWWDFWAWVWGESVGKGQFLHVKCWMLNCILCTSLGSEFLTREIWEDGIILLNIHRCFKCDSCPGEPCVGCEVFAASLLLRGLLENMCGKVRAIAVVILKIEASFSASHQILGVVAGVASVERVCWSGYNNTQLFVVHWRPRTGWACPPWRLQCSMSPQDALLPCVSLMLTASTCPNITRLLWGALMPRAGRESGACWWSCLIYWVTGQPDDEMNLKQWGADRSAVYATARTGRDGEPRGRPGGRRDFRRNGGRGERLLPGDNEVLLDVFGSRPEVWDKGQATWAWSSLGNDRSEIR